MLKISVQITFEIKGTILKRKSPFHGTLVVRLWFQLRAQSVKAKRNVLNL